MNKSVLSEQEVAQIKLENWELPRTARYEEFNIQYMQGGKDTLVSPHLN